MIDALGYTGRDIGHDECRRGQAYDGQPCFTVTSPDIFPQLDAGTANSYQSDEQSQRCHGTAGIEMAREFDTCNKRKTLRSQ